jgi:hypothetical protein
MLLTERNTISHRYPCIVDRTMYGGPAGDTTAVLYLADLVAGSALYGQGPFTRNPIICQLVPATAIGVNERDATAGRSTARSLRPTVVRSLQAGAVAFDATGRSVTRVTAGVYFVREGPSAIAVRKVVMTR